MFKKDNHRGEHCWALRPQAPLPDLTTAQPVNDVPVAKRTQGILSSVGVLGGSFCGCYYTAAATIAGGSTIQTVTTQCGSN